jgi:hypothetical protein
MSAYLAEHLPHLQSLHRQLALGEEALASDQSRIEAAIKAAVSTLLREREAEVDAWTDWREEEGDVFGEGVGPEGQGCGRRQQEG